MVQGQASFLGSSNKSEGNSFDGMIDEFRVTNSALPDDFIENMYNAEKDPTSFVREGIYLTETLSLTATTTGVGLGVVQTMPTETLALTDTITKTVEIQLSETLELTYVATGVKDTREIEPTETLALTDTITCLLYTSPSPRDVEESRMPSSA